MANTFLRQLLAFEFPFCEAFGTPLARRKESRKHRPEGLWRAPSKM